MCARARHPAAGLPRAVFITMLLALFAPSGLLQKPLARRLLHLGSRDTAQARKAVELFLAKASPAAAGELDALLEARGRPPLDALLLDALRGEDLLVPDGEFRNEWVAFATGAQLQHRSTEARRAWAQQDAFGDAPALESTDGECASGVVADEGVALVRNVLGAATAEALRAFVLAERDNAEALAASDQVAGKALLSRVLSPRDAGAAQATRWDVRLPWDPVVSDAVREMLAGPLGDAFSQLSSGGSDVGGAAGAEKAALWECAAVVSQLGAAPQIVHGDTTFSPEAAMFTAFVALQPVERHMGPTRFLGRTHHGPAGSAAHDALAADLQGVGYCGGAASTVALLATGDATLYDSRLHHCGGPHLEAPTRASKERPSRALEAAFVGPLYTPVSPCHPPHSWPWHLDQRGMRCSAMLLAHTHRRPTSSTPTRTRRST